jgi:hypothetical protein
MRADARLLNRRTTLSFRAEPELIAALDEEAKRMAEEKKGLKLSRTDAVKVLLWEGLEARSVDVLQDATGVDRVSGSSFANRAVPSDESE